MLKKLKVVVAVSCVGLMGGCGKYAVAPDSTTGAVSKNDATRIVQLTTAPAKRIGGLGMESKLSGDGSKVVFASDLQPGGKKTDNGRSSVSKELFIVNSDGTGLVQLTNSSAQGVVDGLMDLSADGGMVVFTSEADYLGLNPDQDREVYIIHSDGTGLTQLSTDDNGHMSQAPNITANGRKIAFISTADPLGANPGHYWQIFTINSDKTALKQVTQFNANVTHMNMSSDGGKIVFSSRGDVMGAGSDYSEEIYLINADGSGLAQLTNTAEDSTSPRISGDGRVIIFTSTADLVAGQNPDPSSELFMMNSDGSGLRQITQTSLPFNVSWMNGIEISDDGSTVVFASTDNMANENPKNRLMVFAYKTDSGRFVRVNPRHSENYATIYPSVSSNGGRITTSSRVDYTGGNPRNNPEFFMHTHY